jgi:hypothetical protein
VNDTSLVIVVWLLTTRKISRPDWCQDSILSHPATSTIVTSKLLSTSTHPPKPPTMTSSSAPHHGKTPAAFVRFVAGAIDAPSIGGAREEDEEANW